MYRNGKCLSCVLRQSIDYLHRIFLHHRNPSNHSSNSVLGSRRNGSISYTKPRQATLLNAQPNNIDFINDHYQYVGLESPKIVITTSKYPSSQLKLFVKQLKYIFPNAKTLIRADIDIIELIQSCLMDNVTDLIVVHAHRGVPAGLEICHLPYGPTAYFHISNLLMKNHLKFIGAMPEKNPYVFFHNFKSQLGHRVVTILKNLFPIPRRYAKRVIMFEWCGDFISFKQYRSVERRVHMSEEGPRFQLTLQEIEPGTLTTSDVAHIEWSLRPYFTTAVRRRMLNQMEEPNLESA